MREEIIRTKLKQIKESIKSVKENLPSSLKKFISLGLIKDGIYKRIEFSIENVLDICNIINADLELGLPSEEEEVIDNLVKNKILSEKLGKKVKGMRGFRNFLVHRYGLIDDRIAFKSIRGELKDFSEFQKEILKFITKKKK